MTLRVGLTGGIGSGKSTVAAAFCALGAPVVDIDQISRTLTHGKNGAALPQIRTTFGGALFEADGTLSRAQLRQLVFASPPHKKQLEAILHPLIHQEAFKQFEEHAAQNAEIVIFDIPLLVESHFWQHHLDRILVVDCEEQTQRERVMARSGWSGEQVQAVIAQQATRQQRLTIATDTLYNENITLDELHQQVMHLLSQWQEHQKQPNTATKHRVK